MQFELHQDETDIFSLDFTDRLASGEVLVDPPEAYVSKLTLAGWQDASVEFSIAAVLDGTEKIVQITLGTPAQNPAKGEYNLSVRVATSNGRTLVGDHPIVVLERGGSHV